MKSFLLIMMTLLFTLSQANAQNSNIEITGKWKVVGIKINPAGLSKTEVQKAEVFGNSFLRSTFIFFFDKGFSFNVDDKDLEVENGHWKYNPTSKSYIVQEWKDKDEERAILMEIIAEKKADKTFFLITETPFILEVQKQN